MQQTILLTPKKGSLVSTEHVNTLVKNYKIQRWKNNSAKIGKPDSLSTWFGIDELQSFLQEARLNKADGIKMFFGVYPADYPDELIAGRQTIVLVATRKNENHPGARNKALVISRDDKKQLLAFNKGEMCPPYCGGIPPDYDNDLSMELDPIGLSIIEENGNLEII